MAFQIPEVTLSLVVGKETQQAKKIPMNAPGRGDYAGRKARRTSCARQGWVLAHPCPLCVLLKRKKAESEAQRGKPKGTLESESRNAIV